MMMTMKTTATNTRKKKRESNGKNERANESRENIQLSLNIYLQEYKIFIKVVSKSSIIYLLNLTNKLNENFITVKM